MKKYFVLFCLLLIPFSLQAHLLKANKWTLLEEAKKHKKEAVSELYFAEDMIPLLPNLGKREHLQILIASAIAASNVPEPRAKILSIGLTLIGSLANNMYDEYCEFRSHLANAAYHFEMANFYSQLSMQFNDWPEFKDEGTKWFLKSIDKLTLCDMLATCINDDWIQIAISNELTYQRDRFVKQMNNADGKLTEKISDQGWMLYENINEILSECEDEALKEDISLYIYAMWEDMQLAEKAWGIK